METLSSGETLSRGDDRLDFGDGGGHLTVGFGLNVPIAGATGEARMRLGVARGQDEFASRWLPSVAASIGIAALGDRLAISLDQRWFRIPFWETRYSDETWRGVDWESRSDGAATLWNWKDFRAVVVGIRF